MAVLVTSATLHSCATGKHTSGFHSNATQRRWDWLPLVYVESGSGDV